MPPDVDTDGQLASFRENNPPENERGDLQPWISTTYQAITVAIAAAIVIEEITIRAVSIMYC